MKKTLLSLTLFFTYFLAANPVEITEKFSLKKEIQGKRIYLSLFNGSQKVGFASGTEFPEYIILGVLNVPQQKDRNNGHGTRLLEEFLDYAKQCNKFVLAKVYPMDSNDLSGLLKFYEKRGAQVVKPPYIDEEDGIEKAAIAFRTHVTETL